MVRQSRASSTPCRHRASCEPRAKALETVDQRSSAASEIRVSPFPRTPGGSCERCRKRSDRSGSACFRQTGTQVSDDGAHELEQADERATLVRQSRNAGNMGLEPVARSRRRVRSDLRDRARGRRPLAGAPALPCGGLPHQSGFFSRMSACKVTTRASQNRRAPSPPVLARSARVRGIGAASAKSAVVALRPESARKEIADDLTSEHGFTATGHPGIDPAIVFRRSLGPAAGPALA